MRRFAAMLLLIPLAGCSEPVTLTPQDRAERAALAGQWDEAINTANDILATHPRDAAAYTTRGRGYFGKRDNERALADYNQAIEIDATNSEAHYSRAVVLRALGRKDEAKEDDEIARRYDSNRKLFDYMAGAADNPTPDELVDKIKGELPKEKTKPIKEEPTKDRSVTKEESPVDERTSADPTKPVQASPGPMDPAPRKPMRTLSDEFIEEKPTATPKPRAVRKPVVEDEPMAPAPPPRRVVTGPPGAPPRGPNSLGPANARPGQPQRGGLVRGSANALNEAAKAAPPRRQMGGRVWPPVTPQGAAAAGVPPKPMGPMQPPGG